LQSRQITIIQADLKSCIPTTNTSTKASMRNSVRTEFVGQASTDNVEGLSSCAVNEIGESDHSGGTFDICGMCAAEIVVQVFEAANPIATEQPGLRANASHPAEQVGWCGKGLRSNDRRAFLSGTGLVGPLASCTGGAVKHEAGAQPLRCEAETRARSTKVFNIFLRDRRDRNAVKRNDDCVAAAPDAGGTR
jgi:hypothetical protein